MTYNPNNINLISPTYPTLNLQNSSLNAINIYPNEWTYVTTQDDLATVSANGYFDPLFRPSQQLRLPSFKVNDIIWATCTDMTAALQITAVKPTINTKPTGSSFPSPNPVSGGGTGVDSFTPFELIAGGATPTGPLQEVSGTGTAGQVLTSNGAGTLPTWQPSSAGGTVTGGANEAQSGSQVFDSVNSTSSTLKFNEFLGGAGITLSGGGNNTAITITNSQPSSGGTVMGGSSENGAFAVFDSASSTSSVLKFNGISAGTGISIAGGGDNAAIIISSTSAGGSVTGGANNSESGSTVFDSANSTASTLKFNELIAGTGITITGGGSDTAIIISSSAGGGTVTGGLNESQGGSQIFDSANSTSTTLHFNELVAGAGISLSGGGSAAPITITATGVLGYVNQTSSPVTMVADTVYGANSTSLITFVLPTAVTTGSIFQIAYVGTGGWTITYSTNQIIQYGNVHTTITSGSLSSSAVGDCVTILCTTANTGFIVINSVGNLTYA